MVYRVAGFDHSYKKTAMAVSDGRRVRVLVSTVCREDEKWVYYYWNGVIRRWLEEVGRVDFCVVEDIACGGMHRGLVGRLAKSLGVLLGVLSDRRITYDLVTPTRIKKVVVGKGVVGKREVVDFIRKEVLGRGIGVEVNFDWRKFVEWDGNNIKVKEGLYDIADAIMMCEYGFIQLLGCSVKELSGWTG